MQVTALLCVLALGALLAEAGRPVADFPQNAWQQNKLSCHFKLTEHERDEPSIETPGFHPTMEMPPRYAAEGMSAAQDDGHEDDMPKVVITSHERESIPNDLFRNIKENFERNTGYSLKYFSDHTARDFIQVNMNPRVLEAYDMLIPGQYKADLFRYCYLYTNGGIWMDSDIVQMQPFNQVLEQHHELLVLVDTIGEVIDPMILGAVPHHPVIAHVLEKAVDNILNHRYGVDYSAITGAVVLTEAVQDVFPHFSTSKPRSVKVFTKVTHGRCAIHKILSVDGSDGVQFGWTSYPEYFREMRMYVQKKSYKYAELWKKRAVFNLDPAIETHDGTSCARGAVIPPKTNARFIANVEKELADILPFHLAKNQQRPVGTSTPRTGRKKASSYGGELARGDALKQRPSFRENFPVPRHYRSQIPKMIVQISAYDQVPKRMREAMESILADNREYQHRYFSYKRAAKYIKENCGENSHQAFKTHGIHELKQDIFKYCFLHTNGGVYIDATYAAPEGGASLTDAIGDNDVFLTVAQPPTNDDGASDGVQHFHGGLIASVKEHPLFKSALKKAVADHISGQVHYKSSALTRAFNAVYRSDAEKAEVKFSVAQHVELEGCIFDEIRVAGLRDESRKRTSGGRKDHAPMPTLPPQRLFWAGYVGVDDDLRWYPREEEDYPRKSAWLPRRTWDKE